jgi:hypothetical protein
MSALHLMVISVALHARSQERDEEPYHGAARVLVRIEAIDRQAIDRHRNS